MPIPNEKRLVTAKMIWLVFLSSQFLVAGTPYLMMQLRGADPAASDKTVLLALQAMGFAEFAAGFLLPKVLTRLSGKFSLLVIQYALFEACSLFGAISALLVGDPNQGLPFALMGMVGILFHMPTPERVG